MKPKLFSGLILLIVLVGLTVSGGQAAPKAVYPDETWEKAPTPEALGWSPKKLVLAREYAERIGSAAVMIVDNGVVVDAWGDVSHNYNCHSVRKSLLSALYGIYVADGKINISKIIWPRSSTKIKILVVRRRSLPVGIKIVHFVAKYRGITPFSILFLDHTNTLHIGRPVQRSYD